MQKLNYIVSKRDYDRKIINLRETPEQNTSPNAEPLPVEPTPRVEPAPRVEPTPRTTPAPVDQLPQENTPRADEPEIRFRLSSPYPAITNATEDMGVVRALKKLTAGRCGEFTAVNTYFYQYLILKNSYPEIANALREIALVELSHFEILSEAIVDFGGDPTLSDGQGNVWTGRNINTQKDVKKLLLDNIRAEENGVKRLETVASKVNNVSLSELLLRIIEDEKNHVIILNKLLSTI